MLNGDFANERRAKKLYKQRNCVQTRVNAGAHLLIKPRKAARKALMEIPINGSSTSSTIHHRPYDVCIG